MRPMAALQLQLRLFWSTLGLQVFCLHTLGTLGPKVGVFHYLCLDSGKLRLPFQLVS